MKQIISLIFIFLSISVLNAQEDTKQDTIAKPLVEGKLSNGVTIKDIIEKRKANNNESDFDLKSDKITKFPLYSCSSDLDLDAQKKCLNRSMQKHVARRFKADIANTHNVSTGKYRIYCFFTISKEGLPTNIEIYSKYKVFEEEGKRVIELLPKTNPAMVKNKPVALKYMLPITFSAE